LESLDSLKSNFQVGAVSLDKSFLKVLELKKSKDIFSFSSISWSKHKKRAERRREDATQNVEPNSVKPSEVVGQNERLSKDYLGRLDAAWQSYEAKIKLLEQGQGSLKLFQNEKPRAKKSSISSVRNSSTTRLKLLSDFLMTETLSESKLPEFSVLQVKVALYRHVPLTEKK
jgi:hypothetical protein